MIPGVLTAAAAAGSGVVNAASAAAIAKNAATEADKQIAGTFVQAAKAASSVASSFTF